MMYVLLKPVTCWALRGSDEYVVAKGTVIGDACKLSNVNGERVYRFQAWLVDRWVTCRTYDELEIKPTQRGDLQPPRRTW